MRGRSLRRRVVRRGRWKFPDAERAGRALASYVEGVELEERGRRQKRRALIGMASASMTLDDMAAATGLCRRTVVAWLAQERAVYRGPTQDDLTECKDS